MIIKVVILQNNKEMNELINYQKFIEAKTNAIIHRKIISYIIIRLKYKDYFNDQLLYGTFDEWAGKLMEDMCAIIK